MCLTMWWLCKTLITILALIKFYSCVRAFMLLAMWWITYFSQYYFFAPIRFHSGVGTFMVLAIWWLWKTLITMLALIRFHSCVHALCNTMNNSSSYHNTCTHTAFFVCGLVHIDGNLMTYEKMSCTILPLINRFYYCVGTFMLCTMWWLHVKPLLQKLHW